MNHENLLGIAHLWQEGDFLTRTVSLVLLGMSVLSWTVILRNVRRLKHLDREGARMESAFWRAGDLEENLRALPDPSERCLFRHLAKEGLKASKHHHRNRERIGESLNPSEWLARCLEHTLENIRHGMQSGLPILASIGNTAPFVGLLGTVWGIYHALLKIGLTHEATIDKVAGPVGESLIMTAFGLAVAIPAVLGYNALTQGNRKILARLRNFAYELHACLLTGERIRVEDAA